MVHIITDSGADFEPDELIASGIKCIPITVVFGTDEYQENVNMSKQLFYELLKTSRDFPKTAQPSPLEFEKLFSECVKQGDEAVVITLSSALSGLYQNVTMVKTALEYDGCHIVDSLTAAGGQRILVEHAIRLRDKGKSAGEIAAELENLKGRIELYACLDTLEYLYRGGRISRTAYALAAVSNVKPIVHVTGDGQVEVVAKMLGMSRGISYMRSQLSNKEPDPDYPPCLMYTYNRNNAELLAKSLEKDGHEFPENRIVGVGAAIGTHVGPNCCGVVYIRR